MPTDDLTFMLMVPYKRVSMDHITRTGVEFTTRTEGLGDIKLMANRVMFRQAQNRHSLTLVGGVSLPTGSIDERDATPMGPNQKLPYPMQLGSGTYDLLAGINYLGLKDNYFWGAQGKSDIKLGTNDNDYRLGDIWELSTWVTRRWTNWLSSSVRLHGQTWGDIDGADPDLNAAIVPTADPARRAGTRLDLLLSVELFAPRGSLKGQRFGIELGTPIYQSLDGPQLEVDWHISVGWQWIF